MSERRSAPPNHGFERVAITVIALMTMGFSFDDEPTVHSQDELAVATSGSHNLRRRSNG